MYSIHTDVEVETYASEKYQLLEQGFKLSGDIIEANDIEEAYKIHKSTYYVENAEYPLLGTLINLPQALALRSIFGG